jgi:hypothetical protein
VIDVVTNELHEGLVVLAHCTGPKGAIAEMSGVQKTSLFQHPNLLAVDVAEEDFFDPEKKKAGTRVIDLLDGNHKEFSFGKIGIIQSSDSPHPSLPAKHGLEGIGARYTYLKLDERIGLGGPEAMLC